MSIELITLLIVLTFVVLLVGGFGFPVFLPLALWFRRFARSRLGDGKAKSGK